MIVDEDSGAERKWVSAAGGGVGYKRLPRCRAFGVTPGETSRDKGGEKAGRRQRVGECFLHCRPRRKDFC